MLADLSCETREFIIFSGSYFWSVEETKKVGSTSSSDDISEMLMPKEELSSVTVTMPRGEDEGCDAAAAAPPWKGANNERGDRNGTEAIAVD